MAARLAGKCAVISGAGSGIGQAICKTFAKEGASVMLVDKTSKRIEKLHKELPEKHGNSHFFCNGDVSDKTFVSQLFSESNSCFKRNGDILVNCAGITRDSLLMNMSEAQFDEVIDVNLKSIFLMTQSFIASLKHSAKIHPASIINISSIVGKSGNAGQANYAASKSGVIGFTKTVGIEMGRFGVRCNAVLPGFIETPMTAVVPEKIISKLLPLIPAKRLGTPEEVANACLFLGSDESSYVNCACLEVTGGLNA